MEDVSEMSELADMEILDSENDDLSKVIGLDPTAVDLMRLNQKVRNFAESADFYEVEEISFPLQEPNPEVLPEKTKQTEEGKFKTEKLETPASKSIED